MIIPENIEYGVCVNDPSLERAKDFSVELYKHAMKRISLHGKYKAIEYSHVVHLTIEECKQIKEDTLALGLRPWSAHSEHLNAFEERRIDEYFKWQTSVAKNAAELGCEIFVFHPPNCEMPWKKTVEIVGDVVKLCGDYGIRPAMENVYSGPCIETGEGAIEFLVRLANDVNNDLLGFTIDTGHANLTENMTAQDAIRLMGSRVISTHLQDNCGRNDDHLPPGLGKIDWREVMLALWEVGYAGPMLIEITGEAGKNRRPDAGLQGIPTEVEQALGANYLDFVHKVLKDELPFKN